MSTIYIPGPPGAPVGICQIGSLHPRRLLYYAPAEAALGAPAASVRDNPRAESVHPPFPRRPRPDAPVRPAAALAASAGRIGA